MRSPVCGQVNPTQGFVFFPEKRFAFRRNPHSMKGKPVAQKVQVLLVDDLNGGEADETVTFALDGKSYEIDLSDSNAQKLRDSLADFVKATAVPVAVLLRAVARRVPLLPAAARTPRRSVPGRRRTATTSMTVAASPPTFVRHSRRPTADRPSRGPIGYYEHATTGHGGTPLLPRSRAARGRGRLQRPRILPRTPWWAGNSPPRARSGEAAPTPRPPASRIRMTVLCRMENAGCGHPVSRPTRREIRCECAPLQPFQDSREFFGAMRLR